MESNPLDADYVLSSDPSNWLLEGHDLEHVTHNNGKSYLGTDLHSQGLVKHASHELRQCTVALGVFAPDRMSAAQHAVRPLPCGPSNHSAATPSTIHCVATAAVR